MPYGLIVVGAVIVLTLHYVFATGESWISKTLVLGILGFCLGGLFWWHRFSLAALFLLVGLGLYLSLYRICALASASGGRD